MEEKESEGWFKKFISMLGPSDIVAFLGAAIGVCAAIYAAIKTLETAVISMIISQVLLLIGWAYILRYRYKNRIALMKKDEDIKILRDEVESTTTEYNKKAIALESDREHIIKQLFTISNSVKSNNIHSNDILVKIPSEANEQYELLSRLQSIMQETNPDPGMVESLRKDAKESAKKYAVDLYDAFNRYCREVTDEAVKLQNAYLSLKKIPLQVSVTVKLMNRPYHPNTDNISDVRVYTAFRDHEVYSDHEREVGEQIYTVSGNTAFIQCLSKDYFIRNNIKPNDDSYANEHRRYDEFYNCAICVPIRLKRADGNNKFFGFFSCDCLNNDPMITEALDRSAAQYMFAFAQNIATFLETLDANWIDRYQGFDGVSPGILEMLFKKIFKQQS